MRVYTATAAVLGLVVAGLTVAAMWAADWRWAGTALVVAIVAIMVGSAGTRAHHE